MTEQPHRSLAKAVSWRVIASFTTMGLVFVFTRELVLTFGVGIADILLKLLFYYLHERLWNRIAWGKVLVKKRHNKNPLSSI